jgi:hypothetical protein
LNAQLGVWAYMHGHNPNLKFRQNIQSCVTSFEHENVSNNSLLQKLMKQTFLPPKLRSQHIIWLHTLVSVAEYLYTFSLLCFVYLPPFGLFHFVFHHLNYHLPEAFKEILTSTMNNICPYHCIIALINFSCNGSALKLKKKKL